MIGIISLIPTPPVGHSVFADEKPPSTARVIPAKSTLKTQTTHVEAIQTAVEPERVQTPTLPPEPVIPPPTPATDMSCGDNEFANYIYMHESGCRVDAVNSIGCRGIGQACPGDKLPCGPDYTCQNAWFTSYAIQRYGSWQGAYQFWLGHSWW